MSTLTPTTIPSVPRLDNYDVVHPRLVPVLDDVLVDGLLEIIMSGGLAAQARAVRRLCLHLESRRVARDLGLSRGLCEATRRWESIYVDPPDAPPAPSSTLRHTALLVETDAPYFAADLGTGTDAGDGTAIGVPS